MKRSKLRWIAFSAAVVLIAVGTTSVSAAEPGDKLVGGSKARSYVGDEPSGVATVSYVGDLNCDGCSGGGCDAGGCSGCGGSGCGGARCGGLLGRGCAGGNCGGGNCAGGNCGGGCGNGRSYGRPDLFYNYYTQGNSNRTNAQMYLSPLPVPPNVGHTYLTYQPFHPHEMLYWHKDKFHNYYDGGRGMNRTRATYYSPPIRQAASNLYWNKIRLPR